MKSENRKVRAAQFGGDSEALSRMGRAGGRATARKRAQQSFLREAEMERAAELAAREEDERARAANEHIVPVDPDDD